MKEKKQNHKPMLFEVEPMEKTPDLELKALNTFIGTQNYYNVMGVLVTDGVKYLMGNGYAWFVTDAIAVIKCPPPKLQRCLQKENFLTVKLKLNRAESEADLIIEDGNYNRLHHQHYDYTDAKKELTLFYTDNVLMLNSEY